MAGAAFSTACSRVGELTLCNAGFQPARLQSKGLGCIANNLPFDRASALAIRRARHHPEKLSHGPVLGHRHLPNRWT